MLDYKEISKNLNDFGRDVLECIKTEYSQSLSSFQLDHIAQSLQDNQFIIVDNPSKEDLKFFGIKKDDSNIPNAPSAHGGRTKNDDKIHIIPLFQII